VKIRESRGERERERESIKGEHYPVTIFNVLGQSKSFVASNDLSDESQMY